jgi:hypothetical protein
MPTKAKENFGMSRYTGHFVQTRSVSQLQAARRAAAEDLEESEDLEELAAAYAIAQLLELDDVVDEIGNILRRLTRDNGGGHGL